MIRAAARRAAAIGRETRVELVLDLTLAYTSAIEIDAISVIVARSQPGG